MLGLGKCVLEVVGSVEGVEEGLGRVERVWKLGFGSLKVGSWG